MFKLPFQNVFTRAYSNFLFFPVYPINILNAHIASLQGPCSGTIDQK